MNCDGQEAIVKKVWPLDDSHSFVGLFDIAISVADLRRIHEQDLPTPDKPLADYDCKVEIRLQEKIPLSIMLRVRDNHELQAQFRRLLKTDDRFREAVQHCILDDITCHKSRGQGLPRRRLAHPTPGAWARLPRVGHNHLTRNGRRPPSAVRLALRH